MITYGDCWEIEIVGATVPPLYRKWTKPQKTGTERLKFSARGSRDHYQCPVLSHTKFGSKPSIFTAPTWLPAIFKGQKASTSFHLFLQPLPAALSLQFPTFVTEILKVSAGSHLSKYPVYPLPHPQFTGGKKKAQKRALSETIFLIKYLLNTLVKEVSLDTNSGTWHGAQDIPSGLETVSIYNTFIITNVSIYNNILMDNILLLYIYFLYPIYF